MGLLHNWFFLWSFHGEIGPTSWLILPVVLSTWFFLGEGLGCGWRAGCLLAQVGGTTSTTENITLPRTTYVISKNYPGQIVLLIHRYFTWLEYWLSLCQIQQNRISQFQNQTKKHIHGCHRELAVLIFSAERVVMICLRWKTSLQKRLKARSHCAFFFSYCNCDFPYRNKWVVQDSMEVFTRCDCNNIPRSYVVHCKQKQIAVANRTVWVSLKTWLTRLAVSVMRADGRNVRGRLSWRTRSAAALMELTVVGSFRAQFAQVIVIWINVIACTAS